MDEVWKQFGTPIFWVTIVISVLAGLLTTYLGRGLDRRSAARKARREAASAKFAADLQLLSERPDLVPLYISEEHRSRSDAFVLALGGGVVQLFNVFVVLQNGPKVTIASGGVFFTVTVLCLLLISRGGDAFAESRRHGGVLQALFTKQRSMKKP